MDDWSITTIFVTFAGGPGWVFYNLLFLELPYFQQHQPEGLCLATFMNVCANAASLIVLLYFILDMFIFYFDIDIVTIIMLFVAPICIIICSFVYSISVDGISWPLYVFSLVAGMIGDLTPDLTQLNPNLTRDLSQLNPNFTPDLSQLNPNP